MAVIETGMYSNQQAPDILGGLAQGMRLKDMANQQAQTDKTNQFNKALQDSYTPDASGKLQFNPNNLGSLAKIDPAKAYALQTQTAASNQAAQEAHLDFVGKQMDAYHKMLGDATDAPSYAAMRSKAIQNGLANPQELPEQYDKTYVDGLREKSLDLKSQFENKFKAQGLGIQQQEADAKTKTAADTHADRIQKMDTTQSTKSDDAYQKAMKDMNSFRGNTAVQQASSALTNAKNAMSLADKGNLSTADLHLFASEMGKLATNGVPGQGEIDALVPNTAKTQLAKVTQFFANSPSDAQAQDFINHNKPYLKDLLNNYGTVVDTYKNNIVDGYKKKLAPEDYAELKGRIKSQSAVMQSAPQGMPKPGDVEDGHVFLGGDPANPQSWKAQ